MCEGGREGGNARSCDNACPSSGLSCDAPLGMAKDVAVLPERSSMGDEKVIVPPTTARSMSASSAMLL